VGGALLLRSIGLVTLAQRLLIAIGLLTMATTAAFGFGVREAWRRTEEQHFQERFAFVRTQLEKELNGQVADLQNVLSARCRHDPVIDSALVDLNAGNLDRGRRLSLSLQVRELMKALALDELTLVTGSGEVLGAGHAEGLVGSQSQTLRKTLEQPARAAALRAQPPLALEAHCTRSNRDAGLSGRRLVGLVGARHIGVLVDRIGKSQGVELGLARPAGHGALVAAFRLEALGGVTVYGSQPRVPLEQALRALDVQILITATVTVGLALLLAWLFSRGLARPIVRLSHQVREVVHGEPKPIRGGGGRELEELAQAFNRTIGDLTAMRKRLAATERIAARREIARRVAHEIKNPLAPIRAAVETLRRLRSRNDPAFEEYFDEATRTVLDEVARISNIVSEFTRFARLPPPNPTALDPVEVVRKVVALHNSGGTPIEYRHEPCPKLLADRDQLVQVTTNLLQNALDAVSAAADPKVTVQVVPSGSDGVELTVRDNGPGVSLEMRERLFQPYATTKPQGTGLGLSIVERIVVEHGGEISYRDAPAGGAEFKVVLPLSGPGLLAEAPTSTPLGPA
jgi:two-component system, NtrC family, nitrogen regulation sensor histidine kinase NtrY